MVILPHRRKAFRSADTPAVETDPYFANVVWLLHCDESTFIDSSSYARSTNLINSPSASTPAKYGANSYQADGSSYIYPPDSSDFTFGTGDFTIEMWIRFPTGVFTGSAATYGRTVIDFRPSSTNGYYIVGGISPSRILGFYVGITGAGILTLYSTTTLDYNTWYHVALTRSGTTARLFVNGVQEASGTSSISLLGTRPVLSRNAFLGDIGWVGGIDDVRITKGVARYVDNFTPPSAPFPDVGNPDVDPYFSSVSLLAHMNGSNNSTTFIDKSIFTNSLTANGDAKITTAQSKFNGSSGLFDGTGDYVSGNSTNFYLGSDPFTVEFWINPISLSNFGMFHFVNGALPSNTSGFALGYNSQFILYIDGLFWQFGGSLSATTWSHVAVVRSGTAGNYTIKIYVNGVALTNTLFNSSAQVSVDFSNVYIGAYYSAQYCTNGYLAEFRLTKGVARYFSNFTPPDRAHPDTAGRPSFIATSSIASDANVSVPSGTIDGDLMLAFVTVITPVNVITPSGWTRLGSIFTWTTYGYGTALFYRVASSEPASYSFGAGNRVGFMVTYRNASAIDSSGSYEQKSGTSMAFTGISSSSGSMLLSFIHDRENSPGFSLTQPSGMTLRLNSPGTYFRCGAADLPSAGNSTRTWTASNNVYDAVGVLVAIK